MLDDNLNKAKLVKMIGTMRFETAESFKDSLEEPIQKNFLIADEERLGGKSHETEKRADLYILDKLTNREVLINIGFKVVKDSPELTNDDIQAFHTECQKLKSQYGVLMTETEVHFYEYAAGQPTEIKDIQPLNYIDAEFEDHMTPQKYKDWAISKKFWLLGAALIIIFIIAGSLAQAQRCKTSGPIKAEVRSDGQKMYYLPETTGYENRTTGDQPGEQRYCNEQDAIDDGFTLAK